MDRTSTLILALAVALGSCSPPPAVPDAHDAAAATLEAFERELRPAVRARLLAGGRSDHGADPLALAQRGDDVFALLQGRDRLLVVAGPAANASASTAPFPNALVVDGDDIVVGSAVAGGLQRFRLQTSLTQQEPLPGAPDFAGVSALAAGQGLVDVGTLDGEVVTLRGSTELGRCWVGPGLSSLQRLPAHLVALSSLAHVVVVFALDADGAPLCARAQQEHFDGLLFTLLGSEEDAAVDVIVSGIEDHPLDRLGGSFGNIDSFLFRLRFDDEGVTRLWETNLSSQGVVNGKALVREGDDVVVFGAGSGRFAVVDVDSGSVTSTGAALAGVSTALVFKGQKIVASALQDAVDVGGTRLALEGPPSALERVGERLVFTTMMAPGQRSDGSLSRFTCESCHLGGGGDGRIHHTGRFADGEAVTATTKPLWGLFQNPPLFTRALDRSVAVMVHAEFKVANANSGVDPWFSAPLDPNDPGSELLSPLELRRAMIAFLSSFDPPPNARAFGRSSLDVDEARGLEVFRQRCLSCHDARVFANEAESAGAVDIVPPLLQGALVWGRAGHEDTGVRPRVHPDGARPSGLRGIALKTPLLTNGTSRDLTELLQQVRVQGEGLTHEGTAGEPLSLEDQRVLRRFLLLL